MPISPPEYSLTNTLNTTLDNNLNNKRIRTGIFTVTHDDINTWNDYSKNIVLLNLPINTEILDCKVDITSPFYSPGLIETELDCYIKLNEEIMFYLMMTSTRSGKYICDLTNTSFKNTNSNFILYFNNYNSIASAWAMGGNLPTGTPRYHVGGCGTQTAGLCFGGFYLAALRETVLYDGTTWYAYGGNLNTGRYSLAGCGLQDAALSFGGYTSVAVGTTEEFNGSTWTASTSLSVPVYGPGGCGIQDAGLSIGGIQGSTLYNTSYEYDGSTWTSGGAISISRFYSGSCGIQDAGLIFAGYNTSAENTYIIGSEEYNGSTWSTGGSLSIAAATVGSAGTQTAALSFGGYNKFHYANTNTEKYDGASWYTTTRSSTIRARLGSCGTQSNALSFGGYNFDGFNYKKLYTSEEFTETVTPNKLNSLVDGSPSLSSGSMKILLAYAYS